MLFAVCTECAFLRAFSKRADDVRAPERCPACGGAIEIHGEAERFQPTYVGRVSLDLHRAPVLERGGGNPPLRPL